MNSKYYLLSFCAISISFACVTAEICPNRLSGNITNGVKAELIHADSGALLGIRVSWSWLSSDPVECFQSPEVELSTNLRRIRRALNSISHNNSVEFNITDLDCNTIYLPRVTAILRDNAQLFDNGNIIFFGGSMRSPPSVLPRVCVGPSTSPHLGRVNISWYPLPCHLQNGADITDRDYIIQYTHLSTGVIRRTTSSRFSRSVECSQEVSGLYSCMVAQSQIPNNQSYSFQVAAQNNYGEGSFSDPINVSLPVSSITCTNSADANSGGATTISESILTDVSEDTVNAWTLMGSLVAVITVTAGTVIVVQFFINYTLWKRIKSLKKDHTVITDTPQASPLCDKIDMKECSAYGQVISPQTATEQPHIYESTT